MASLIKRIGANITVSNIIKKIWEFCIDRNLWIFASYIPSKRNKTANKESRKLRDKMEWALHQWVFDKIIQKILYYPDLEASSVNAFAPKWSGRKFYAFPPFSITETVISKIEREQVNGILKMPIFTD